MKFFTSEPEISYNVFVLMRDLIHEKTGNYYEDNKSQILADKLTPRLIERGLDTFLDYYYLLKYDTEAPEEWKYVMEALSVQETFFWREFGQIESLVKVILPAYLEQQKQIGKTDQPVRIWSAAAATGEEALTIAMALDQAGWFNRAQIEIYASDYSESAIDKAQKGIYRERSFRNIPFNIKNKYFIHQGQGWQVNPEIHNKIKWQTANLLNTSEINYLATAPFIFCRNVFIYFSSTAIQKTIQYFHRNMPQTAYLFVSASESLLKYNNQFELQEIAGSFVYVKKTSIDNV